MTIPRSTNTKHDPLQQRLCIVLIDPDERAHAAVRAAFKAHAPCWELVTYNCPLSALDGIPKLEPAPGVALIEVTMPELSGIDCARRLKPLLSTLRVVMLTICADEPTILESITAGALGYLVKPVEAALLVRAVSEVTIGRRCFGSEAQGALADRAQRLGLTGPAQALTLRQREITQYLAQGYRNKDIANKLNLSHKTVSAHISQICEKLKVNSKTEALREFLRA